MPSTCKRHLLFERNFVIYIKHLFCFVQFHCCSCSCFKFSLNKLTTNLNTLLFLFLSHKTTRGALTEIIKYRDKVGALAHSFALLCVSEMRVGVKSINMASIGGDLSPGYRWWWGARIAKTKQSLLRRKVFFLCLLFVVWWYLW